MNKINIRSPYYITTKEIPPLYHSLQKCDDGSVGYISEQTVTGIVLVNNARVQDILLDDYIKVGSSATGTSIGIVTDTGNTNCPVPPAPIYYTLTKCSDSSTGYISGQITSAISLAEFDRVTDATNIIYIVTGEATTGTSVGTVTDTGERNCPAPTPIQPQTIQVNCGDTQNVGTDVGVMTYQVNTPETGNFVVNISGSSVPQKFTLKWNGNEATTNYIGSDTYDADLLNAGVPQGEISTANPSNKISNLVTIAKSTSTPTLVELVVDAPLVNDEYSVSFTCPVTPAVVIEQTTQINIWFDSSGSMNTTLQPLLDMAAGNLKACLIQFYNDDSAEYDKYVRVSGNNEWQDERTFNRALQPPTVVGATNVINIIFQDEASPIYYDSFNPDFQRKPAFNTDIITLRNALNNNPTGYITPIFFQVKVGIGAYTEFFDFMKIVQNGQSNGSNNYAIPYNLSDLSDRVSFKYDILQGITYASNPNYYRDLIIQSINDLGFSITCP